METENSVGDEKRKLTAEEIGRLQVKTNEIVKRLERGSILLEDAITGMQEIIEGKSKRLKLGLIPEKPKKWRDINKVIYFEVTSDGTTGPEWIKRLEKEAFKLSQGVKDLLLSEDFKATSGITYEIAVLKGSIFSEGYRTLMNIRTEAERRNFITPNPEVACLIREMFLDEEVKAMDLFWIFTMHKPIKDSDGNLSILIEQRNDFKNLNTECVAHPGSFANGLGFAFEVSHRPA